MKLLMAMTFLLSTMLIHAHHPIMIMILIISQTLTSCLILWTIMPTAWFSFILFLIFIGGLMVLFIYITSLAANETFNLTVSLSSTQAFLFYALITVSSLTAFFFSFNHLMTEPLNKQISLIFSDALSLQTIIVMSYLLITLIVVVKISTKSDGPLRNIITQN